MSVPRTINDGNHNIPLMTGHDFRFPFADKGDFDSFEMLAKMNVDKAAFRRSDSMTRARTTLGDAYLVEHGDPRDDGLGCFDYDLTYANIPKTRTEGASIAFTQQWWRAVAGTPTEGFSIYPVNYEIAEQTFTLSGEVLFEYFNYRPDPLLYPRVFLVFEFLYSISSVGSYAGKIVAQDSTVDIYKGGIYVRKTPYITINTGERV